MFAGNIVNTCFLHLSNHIHDVTKLTKNVHFYGMTQHEPQHEIMMIT
nr:MAG TPA: hypothetical protein [Caudoviricetes sp.]